ncbi:MAG: purine-nucleoside phosphorylase [Candidatus Hydrogenedens sp.]|jgi:purine-nucleoside phosphorylase|nr:purine-nucleoside phosphorylase [Candidatus Hydrogenedens sp.]
MSLIQKIDQAAHSIQERLPFQAEIAVILGTGLGSLAESIENPVTIDYDSIPHFPAATADGHAGCLIAGTLSGKKVLGLSGRFHLYEGYSMEEVTFPVRVARALGAHTLIISNAAGGMNPQYRAGDLIVITDHINLMGDNPLIGPNDDRLGPRIPDMCEAYTRSLVELAEKAALEEGIKLQRGVYLGCTGPCLETPAEYRFMRIIGADLVGMSTVPEVIVAVHAGLKVLGMSIVTDECFPDCLSPLNLARIIECAEEAEPKLTRLIARCLESM